MSIKSFSDDLMFGQEGSIFTNTNTQVVAPVGFAIIAIQFLADTTFDELSPQKKWCQQTLGVCVGDADGEKGRGTKTAGNETEFQGSGGQIINAGSDSNLTKFPKGMIIYGRWESFTIDADADGGVIAYISK
jgi:hypothetical protein|tara:strand:- start:503 stop:898 length:396 start_codon:yes stop_codon:yes gene_type:complete